MCTVASTIESGHTISTEIGVDARAQSLQSSHPTFRRIQRLVYNRIKQMGNVITAPSTDTMMTRWAIESVGLTKFGVTPGGGGAAPTIVPSETMPTCGRNSWAEPGQFTEDWVRGQTGMVLCPARIVVGAESMINRFRSWNRCRDVTPGGGGACAFTSCCLRERRISHFTLPGITL